MYLLSSPCPSPPFPFFLIFSNLDNIVQNLAKKFAEGSEYFKILVDVFASEFRSDKNAHLKAFHIIVPPLVSAERGVWSGPWEIIFQALLWKVGSKCRLL